MIVLYYICRINQLKNETMEFTIEELSEIAKLACDHMRLINSTSEKKYLEIIKKANSEAVEIMIDQTKDQNNFVDKFSLKGGKLINAKLIKGDIYTCEYIDGDQFIFRFKKYRGGKPSPDTTIVKYYFLYSESSNKSVKNEWAVVKSCDRNYRNSTDREIRLFEYEEQKTK